MNEPVRRFIAIPAVRGEEPLSIGMIGPPGGGKTCSALRLAKGIADVRGGDVVLIDTEAGRARKFADDFKFLHVDFSPPHRPGYFKDVLLEMSSRASTACIIVDSMSDEHEGIGGYLEYHDEMVPQMGGNDWAAWARPKAERKRLIQHMLQVKTPLIFTFRAREKTRQIQNDKGKREIVNIGWQPVAPLEIVHALDLTCILPPRAEGLPTWRSDKIGEDFIIKLPQQFKALFGEARQLDEAHGRALAEWARGAPDVELPPLLDRARANADKGDIAFAAWYATLSSADKKTCAAIGQELRDRINAADGKKHEKPA